MQRQEFRERNMGSSVFGSAAEGAGSIAGMRRVDPNATSPAMQPQSSPARRVDPNSPRPVYRGDGMGAAYEPQQARVEEGKLIVPGLNDARTLDGERRRAESAGQEEPQSPSRHHHEQRQQQQMQLQQHQAQQQHQMQWQPSDVPYLAPPSPAQLAQQRLEPRAHPDSPTGYIPGPVSGISSGTYTSAGTVQPEQLIGRSSTRLLAPPGGASSLGWAFGGDGADASVQARRETNSVQQRGSSRGTGRPRIIAGKIVHTDSDSGGGETWAPAQHVRSQEESQQGRPTGRARVVHQDRAGGWGGPAAAAREEAALAEKQRQQQTYERQQQQKRQQQEALERQQWEQQVREQHQSRARQTPVHSEAGQPRAELHGRHHQDAGLQDISQKMAAAELHSEQAMHMRQQSLGTSSGHVAVRHEHNTGDTPRQVEPSAQYKFARNPAQTIRRAILSQLEQRAMQPRLQWRALCECAGVSRDPTFTRTNALTPEQFCTALKAFGTGILLAPQDVEFVFGGPDSISFSRFCEWCG